MIVPPRLARTPPLISKQFLPLARLKVAQTDLDEAMSRRRAKEEKLERMRLGSRYVSLNLGQFYWQCVKQVAASKVVTERDILRRIIRSWSEALPPAIQEQAQAETIHVEALKAQELRARQDARLQAKQARLSTRRRPLADTLATEM
jgi:hypothetical protein